MIIYAFAVKVVADGLDGFRLGIHFRSQSPCFGILAVIE
jgi:hypothetical protein